MPQCDRCGKVSPKLEAYVRDDDEDLMLCPDCWGDWEMQADLAYDRWREEQGEQNDERT
jgi:hypothetical protein